MAIDQIGAFLAAGKTALDIFKGIRDELPKDAQAEAVASQIKKAEAALDTAKAEAAKALGYRLCQCTFPPQIMLWHADQKKSVCPQCGHAYPPDHPQPEQREGSWAAARRGYGRR